MRTITKISSTLMIAAISAGFTTAQADVQYRIAYDASAAQYAIYMTPDSIPAPDFSVAAQVTVKVPGIMSNSDFPVENIQSNIEGASWRLHSRADKPTEAPNASYLSFGMILDGGTRPLFDWEPGKELKVFTFQSDSGCRSGLDLIGAADPFNQLPNSWNTNPGNNFTNLGWVSANNYNGRYGGAVSCLNDEPAPKLCKKAERKKARIERVMGRLEMAMARLEERRMRLKARLAGLAAHKENVASYCP